VPLRRERRRGPDGARRAGLRGARPQEIEAAEARCVNHPEASGKIGRARLPRPDRDRASRVGWRRPGARGARGVFREV